MSQDLLPKVDRGEFQEVFIEDLNWLAPDVKQSVCVTDAEGRVISARNVASYKGLRVWVCDERPGSALEAELDRLIAKTTTDRLVIFDGEKEQVWRWPVRRAKDGRPWAWASMRKLESDSLLDACTARSAAA